MALEHDWRFAELVARSWTEPQLRGRYLADPHAVLAEAGLTLAAGEPVPALPTDDGLEIVVDTFDNAAEAGAFFCLSLVDEPEPAGAAAA